MHLKRLVAIVTIIVSSTNYLFASPTQYDYYSDGDVSGGTDRVFSAIIIGLIIIVAVIIIVFVLWCVLKIYFFINPDADPERKRLIEKQRKETQQHSLEERLRADAVPEAIDLGLSVKWASFNLGAYKPNDLGCSFYWGDNLPSVVGLYKLSKTILGQKKKYIDVNSIGNIAGNPEYDAARNMLGEKWRMPTTKECEELIQKCDWAVQFIDGIKGQRITGINGNSIFLPYNYKCSREYTGGGYWTSQPSYDSSFKESSYALKFGPHCANPAEIGLSSAYGILYYGIRPVFSERSYQNGETDSIQLQYSQLPNIKKDNIELLYKEYESLSKIKDDEIAENGKLYGDGLIFNRITFNETNTILDKDNVRYSADGKRLLSALECTNKTYRIKDGTEIVCQRAFSSNDWNRGTCICEKIILPETLQYFPYTAIRYDHKCDLESESPNYSIIDNLMIDNRKKVLSNV